MAAIKVEKRKATKFAYVQHVGSYSEIPWEPYMEKLFGWAKAKGVRPGFYPMAIYFDAPQKTPPEKCRSEVGIPISGEVNPEGDILVKDLPEMEVATVSHNGPAGEFQDTYNALNAWIAEHGYIWTGPAMEVYTKKPERVGGQTILHAKVLAPVRRK